LWGTRITDNGVEKLYADINIAAKNYRIKLIKTSSLTGLPLEGAVFGFYNEHGGLITTGTTDENGGLVFQSNITNGIVLRDHVPYYVQELRAPPGYQLDSSKHWICFCDETDEWCEECARLEETVGTTRILHDQTGNIELKNEIMNYDLPATGGPGIYPLMLASVTFIAIPLVYKFTRRRKRERRGTG
jgi:hypothetical protein